MLNRIRDRFGTAGLVVSIMALVLALAGGAFAASGGLNAKQKKQVKAIAKSFQGTGPTGAPGLAGLAGAKGDTGAAGGQGIQGIQGIPGTAGKTVLSGTATPTSGVGVDGDFYIETDVSKIYGPKAAGSWPAGVDLKGATGSPWTAGGTLPPNATETGAFFEQTPTGSGTIATAAISFPVPLATALSSGSIVLVASGGSNANCDNGVAPAPSADNPEADPGFLCVFAGQFGTLDSVDMPSNLSTAGMGTSGAVVTGLGGFGGRFNGSFAVTGATP